MVVEITFVCLLYFPVYRSTIGCYRSSPILNIASKTTNFPRLSFKTTDFFKTFKDISRVLRLYRVIIANRIKIKSYCIHNELIWKGWFGGTTGTCKGAHLSF